MSNPLTNIFGPPQIKTTALAAVVRAYTGSDPIIEKYEDHTEIKFTPEQVRILQQTLTDWHNQKPGTVRVSTGPVFLPYYLRRYWYYIAGVAAIGAVLGISIAGGIKK